MDLVLSQYLFKIYLIFLFKINPMLLTYYNKTVLNAILYNCEVNPLCQKLLKNQFEFTMQK